MKYFSARKKSELFARTNFIAFFSVLIGKHRTVYCHVFCIWRHVNRVAHPVLSYKRRLSESRCYKLVPWPCLVLPNDKKSFLYTPFSVFIGRSHSISLHKPRIPSKKFNMCDFAASTQAFVANPENACEQWCPYIERRRALLCVLQTHVWKPAFTHHFI